jgi:hypothetical protein
VAIAAQLQLDFQPFGQPTRLPRFAVTQYESMIARIPPSRVSRDLYEWKRLRDHGWDVTAVLAPNGSVVMLAYRAHG